MHISPETNFFAFFLESGKNEKLALRDVSLVLQRYALSSEVEYHANIVLFVSKSNIQGVK